MGNCQAAEAATVVIQHPGGGRVERAYWALSAAAVMAANPGHYVAAVITAAPTSDSAASAAAAAAAAAGASGGGGRGAAVKHLKLLRPDDTLLLGHVYRLVSFEEVLKEFTSKRHLKLSRVMIKAKEEEKPTNTRRRRRRRRDDRDRAVAAESDRSLAKVMREPEKATPEAPSDSEVDGSLESLAQGMMVGRRLGSLSRHGHWKPALQSIAEGAVAS